VTFEVVVLGSEPAWPSGPRACSGYLVRTAESTVLIDCGMGVFGRLVDVLAPEGLTGVVVISHLHFDHWADLIPFPVLPQLRGAPERLAPAVLAPRCHREASNHHRGHRPGAWVPYRRVRDCGITSPKGSCVLET
jgi:ribonuclease BN (tRNA processing enzyme)